MSKYYFYHKAVTNWFETGAQVRQAERYCFPSKTLKTETFIYIKIWHGIACFQPPARKLKGKVMLCSTFI